MEKIYVKDLVKIPKEQFYGKVICFPTDTVYGIGVLFDDEIGRKKIYQIKHREQNKPLAILIPEGFDIRPLVSDISTFANDLMKKYWPGPLTLIFTKSKECQEKFNDSFSTIAFRMPDNKISLQILKHLGPMATTSVNISGQAELNSVDEIIKEFGDQIDYIVCDEVTLSKLPSTVLDVSTSQVKVIREGSIKI
ncbi:MAG TPA: L-threonylcarbamoyladenylate synthase [Bacilli bacterium]|nr:L-threonylcarbamoyladenylate synthase [Bacilli bacterium]